MALLPPLSAATAGPRRLAGLQQVQVRLPSMSATATYAVLHAIDGDQEIVKVTFTPDTTDAADNSDYWTFQLQNGGTAGSGTTAMMAAVDTRAVSLDGITAYKAETFTLLDAGKRVLDNEVVKLVVTKAASATTLAGALLTFTIKRATTY